MIARLFVHHRTEPHFNMGFDEWMLSEAAAIPSLILFRLYTWEVGTITFGFNQRQETALDFAKIESTPVIRRITGGRAVYHDISELTYAVAFNTAKPASDNLRGSTGQTSERIARMLSRFLLPLGVSADWVRASAIENGRPDFFHKAACFASHARYELVTGGTKIVASARRDWNGAALQHGSIKLCGLASHQALNSVETTPESIPKSIDLSILNEMEGWFLGAVRQELNIVAKRSEPSKSECRAIDQRTSVVRDRPLEKRELIAHPATFSSQ
jgi:lipoate-protein ligase A